MIDRITHSWLFERFWHFAGGVSIRVKVLGIVLGVIVLLGIFVTLETRSALSQTLHTELLVQGHALSQHILEAVATLEEAEGDEAAIHTLLHTRQEHYSDPNHNTLVAYLVLLDADGQVIASTFDGAVPDALLRDLPTRDNAAFHINALTVDLEEQTVINVLARQTLNGQPQFLHLGLSEVHNQRIVNAVVLRLVSITLVMVAVGFAAAFFLTWVLTRPIYDLVRATQAVERGDLTRRVPRWAEDELGVLAVAFNQMTAALQVADRERTEREHLREEYISGVIHAQESERQRIARELHDSTGQALTAMLVSLKNAQDTPDLTEQTQRLEGLRATINHTLDDVRALAWQLRPSALDDLGLVSALEHYITDYSERYALQVDFAATGGWQTELAARLPHDMETTIYRIVQEALTNIARHAQASAASVVIDRRPASIRVIVEDNGRGFAVSWRGHEAASTMSAAPTSPPPSRVSLGLQGMRERAALFGGTFQIESSPGAGTTIIVEFPLEKV